MPKVYVGSSLLNATAVKSIQERFRAEGIEITYDWTTHGKVESERELIAYGHAEMAGVLSCDLFFMMHPARTGTHVELGLALAANKKIVLVNDLTVEQKPFYYLPNVYRFTSVDEAFDYAMRTLQP